MQIEPKSRRRRVPSHVSLACAVLALAATALSAAALSASPALATGGPADTTGSAQQVQFASATVSGTVNPSGAATSYYFEYGTTSAYGVQTSPTSAGAGTANVAVQQTLSGLTASTTYHYRLVATSPSGTAYGQDATFATTPTPAPAVTTGTATSVSFASASLTGSVNPQGVPTTYYFQYGTTLAYSAKTAVESAGSGTAPQAVTAPIAGLAPASAYHYRLVAASAGGTVVGADATLTTTKTAAPAVATAAATAVGITSATLNATVNPNGVASDYYFQYGTTSSYGRSTPSQSAGSGTGAAPYSAELTGLAPGTTYHYRAVAVSAGGTVDGRDATFATGKTPAPTAVTGAAYAVTTTTASLAGTIDPHGIATSYYFLYGARSPSTRTPAVPAGAGTATVAVSAALANLVPGTTYSYRLVGVGASTVTATIRYFTTAKIPASLSLTAAPSPVAAGAMVTINGTLTGTGVGIRTVALQVEPYPYRRGFTSVGAPEQTSASGAFTFTLPDLDVNTMVRAVTINGSPSLATSAELVRVGVRVGVQVRRHGRSVRFSGFVAPVGAPVQIQIQRRFRGAWITIVRTTTHRTRRGASYAHTIRSAHAGHYRIVAHVRNASLRSGRSRVVTLG
jgi:hypothetical protein